jgi:hypothetical protein
MMSALLSFLGGSVFRMIWGEVSSFVNKRQDHDFELESLRLHSDLDQAAHLRTLENLRLQADLGVRQVEVQRDAIVAQAEADAFTEAMKNAFKPTGIAWVDAWNGVIRPAAASIVLVLWTMKLAQQGFKMEDYDMEISGVVLGFFFADRGLSRRGK